MENISLMSKRTIHLCSADPEQRSEQDIEEVITWIRGKFNHLNCMDSDTLRQVFRRCGHQQCSRDEVVVHQGEVGQNMYMILTGKVSVYVNIRNHLTSAVPATETVAKESAAMETDTKKTSMLETQVKNEQKSGKKRTEGKKSARRLLGKFMVSLYEGQIFGEVALLTDEHIRTASIVSEQPTHLLVIDRCLFEETLQPFMEKEYKCRQQLIQSNPLFQGWSMKNKKSFEWSVQRKKFSFDSVIVSQGQQWDGIMLIFSGQATMQVNPAKHKVQYKHHLPFLSQEDVYEMELNKKTPRVANPQSHLTSPRVEPVATRRKNGYAAAEKRIQSKLVNLCTIESGDIIGDVEAIMGLGTYMYTMKALTEVQVYLVTSRNFERFFSKSGSEQRAYHYMKEQVLAKLETRINTVQGASVPFLKHALVRVSQDGRVPYQRPVVPVKTQAHLPEEKQLFDNLLCNYMNDKAELVTPRVHGGDYYKSVFRANISKISQQQPLHKVKNNKTRVAKRPATVKPRTAICLRKAVQDGLGIIEEAAKRKFIQNYRQQEEEMIQQMRLQMKSRLQNTLSEVNDNPWHQEECNSDDRLYELQPGGVKGNNHSNTSSFITQVDNTAAITNHTVAAPNDPQLLNKQPTIPVITINGENNSQKITRHLSFEPSQRSPNDLEPIRRSYSTLPRLEDKRRTPRLQPHEMSLHENVKEIERLVQPILSENPKYRDCETNDLSLTFLETKVKNFILKQGGSASKNAVKTLPKLQRFELKDEMARQPISGGKVLVKSTPCPVDSGNSASQKNHNHIRSTLLPKLPNYETLKRHKFVRQFSEQEVMSQWLQQELQTQEKLSRRSSVNPT